MATYRDEERDKRVEGGLISHLPQSKCRHSAVLISIKRGVFSAYFPNGYSLKKNYVDYKVIKCFNLFVDMSSNA